MSVRRLLACAALGGPGDARAQAVTEVQVAPPSVTIKVGEKNGLLATAFDRVGNVIPTARVIWSSNNVAVAKVDNNGTVAGMGGGVAIIEARVGARKGTAAVQVVGGPPAPTATTTQPVAPARPTGDPAGPAGPDPLAGQPAGTGPAAVLRIEPPTIYLLPSENTRAAPRALKDDGTPAAPVLVTWKSLRPDIASVDQSGVIVALAPGQGTVQVTSTGGLTATAPVVVQQSDVAVQEPVPLAMSPGDVDTLHVTVPAQGGRLVSPLALQWSTADASVARVNLTGVVIGVAPGRTTLTVAGLLQTKTVEVVVHRTVEQLAVVPTYKADVPLPIQGTTKFVVQGLAADRTPVPEAQFHWTVGDTALASFDAASGTLTGRRAGKTTLTVKGPGPGLSVTWAIRVIAAGLKLSASRLGMPLARRLPLRASFADESGAGIGPATRVSWASDNPSVATVGEGGTVATTADRHARITPTGPGRRPVVQPRRPGGRVSLAAHRSPPDLRPADHQLRRGAPHAGAGRQFAAEHVARRRDRRLRVEPRRQQPHLADGERRHQSASLHAGLAEQGERTALPARRHARLPGGAEGGGAHDEPGGQGGPDDRQGRAARRDRSAGHGFRGLGGRRLAGSRGGGAEERVPGVHPADRRERRRARSDPHQRRRADGVSRVHALAEGRPRHARLGDPRHRRPRPAATERRPRTPSVGPAERWRSTL